MNKTITAETEYPAAIDAWLAIVVVGAFGWMLYEGISRLVSGETVGIILLSGAIIFLFALLAAGSPCRYFLTDERLIIRSGVLGTNSEEIPLRGIKKIAPSRNPLSAPAPSLKRVRIDHAEGFTLISPKNREAFIEEVNRRRSAIG